ncbi:uncharacterized protein FTOL_02462 [Fusarium torulosum]|uniref:Uncharacterized protein n=1 Tax=Fusarium torulosum TaxID=33205 RepID=A0AAE8SEF3_9HYPO|nr:uncharacterized protein FTOL_02462 [Fusarium torulosum]
MVSSAIDESERFWGVVVLLALRLSVAPL